MLEQVKCNLCGADQPRVVFAGEAGNIVRCEKCGFIYKNPRPTERETLNQFVFDQAVTEHKKTVWYDAKIKLFKKNIARIEKYTQPGKLLDVGCGYGTFVKIAKERGWDAQGVEISNAAHKYAQETLGLNVFKGTLRQARFPEGYFDVVTLWDLLELLIDPAAELLEINRILKKNGLLVFRVRNAAFHITIQRLFGAVLKKINIEPTLFHIYQFSPITAKAMLKKAGFNRIKVINSELTQGDPYLTGKIFTPLGVEAVKTVVFYLSRIIFYLSGGGLVSGPSILVFAKKP